MEWQSILLYIIGLALAWASERLIAFLNTKISDARHAKYINDALRVVTSAVKSTYQTYVESLKNKDMFTKDAQMEALNRAKTTASTQLSQGVKKYLSDNFGDVDAWIESNIESTLYDLKNVQ